MQDILLFVKIVILKPFCFKRLFLLRGKTLRTVSEAPTETLTEMNGVPYQCSTD